MTPARLLAHEIAYSEPPAVFARFAGLPGAVFLDSALRGGPCGRYSFIAADPFLVLRSDDGEITCGDTRRIGDPFGAVEDALARYAVEPLPALPPFQTGLAGYFGYELGVHLERVPRANLDDQGYPELLLGLYDLVLAFDHAEQRAWIMASGYPAATEAGRSQRAEARVAWCRSLLMRPVLYASDATTAAVRVTADQSRDAYMAKVRQVLGYIRAGDIYQANLSQRFRARLPRGTDSFALYRTLRNQNAAPFAAYLQFGDIAILSASPERFLRLRHGAVQTRPIKGTRPRGATAAADTALARELACSEKDRAENLMIVDLLRNDLSRVCEIGSVEVSALFTLESFATVHHLVSVVEARLARGRTAVDLLRAAFPGGSITGAPKIRAMEIIAELEPTRRGPYCGSIGYVGFDGSMDTSIAIRTCTIKGDTLTFQVGGGIVADSDPASEYQETLDKAAALLAVLETGGLHRDGAETKRSSRASAR